MGNFIVHDARIVPSSFSAKPSGDGWIYHPTGKAFSNTKILSKSHDAIVITGNYKNPQRLDPEKAFVITLEGNFLYSGDYDSGVVSTFTFSLDDSLALTATDLNLPFSSSGDYLRDFTESLLLNGLSGNDFVRNTGGEDAHWLAGAGDDTIDPGTGDQNIEGGDGVDTLIINADFNESSIFIFYGSAALETSRHEITFQEIEFIQFQDWTIPVTNVQKSDGAVSGDSMPGELRDLMHGSTSHDQMAGLYGADTILGFRGRDTLDGGAGDDVLFGSRGSDQLLGNTGDDRLFGGLRDDTLSGGDDDDRLHGNWGEDVLNGNKGDDWLRGHSGNDTLVGGNGNDTLKGSWQGDLLRGGAGNDSLNGGLDNDRLTGGSGKDIFLFRKTFGNDTITDFSAGTDLIRIRRDLSSIDQLSFEQLDSDVLISFEEASILVQNISLPDLQDTDNFLF